MRSLIRKPNNWADILLIDLETYPGLTGLDSTIPGTFPHKILNNADHKISGQEVCARYESFVDMDESMGKNNGRRIWVIVNRAHKLTFWQQQ